MRQCDAVQVSSQGLAERLAPLARRVEVMANQLPEMPPLQNRPPGGPVRIGWGGSAGHFDDIAAIAPALVAWLGCRGDMRLEVMADPRFEGLFEGAPAERFSFLPAGSLDRYLRWLEGLHIGLAPLLPSDYNHCRSDIKFLEYASRGVVPVLQRCPTYAAVRDGETGLLFGDTAELLALLDGLVADPDRRQRLAAAAHTHVHSQRRLEHHAPRQLDFYHHLLESFPGLAAAEPCLPSLCAAVGMDDLICPSGEAYVERAIELGRDPEQLRQRRQRLLDPSANLPLFDTAAWVGHLENLLERLLREERLDP
jgi:hypothetical protein